MRSTLPRFAVLISLLTFAGGLAYAVATSHWTHNSESDFRKSDVESLAISSLGEVTLSRQVADIQGLEEQYVWSLASDFAGNVYVGTGDQGKIYKLSRTGKLTLLADLEESNVFALAVATESAIYAATSPEAKIYRLTSHGYKELAYDLEDTYVWALTVGVQGDLYIATGDQGKIYKAQPGSQPQLFYDSPETHILALLRDAKGNIYAGTYPHGLVYRIDPEGKPSILFDADEDEIHALALAPDGSVLAATASGGRAAYPGGPPPGAQPMGGENVMIGGTDFLAAAAVTGSPLSSGAGAPEAPRPPAQPPKEPATNSVFKVFPDGHVEKLFSARKTLLYSLALDPDGAILVASGSPGRIYKILEKKQAVQILQTEEAQVLSIFLDPDANVIFGTGNSGRLRNMKSTRALSGLLTSQPLDSGLLSRWGAVDWSADVPEGASLTFATRSGNSAEPDDTWSDWSDETADPSSPIQSPSARFLQYRATLSTKRADASPVLREVKLAYQTFNLPPEVLIILPQRSAGKPGQHAPGQPQQPQQPSSPGTVRLIWKAQDPNGDSLKFDLYYRSVAEQSWKLLEEDLEKPNYSWDTLSVPDGDYLIRVVAGDSPSNPEMESLEGEKISDPLTIDNTRPVISGLSSSSNPDRRWSIAGLVKDESSPIVNIEYSLDADEWKKLPALDGIFDSKEEYLSFEIGPLDPGRHTVVIRAEDLAGNINARSILVEQH